MKAGPFRADQLCPGDRLPGGHEVVDCVGAGDGEHVVLTLKLGDWQADIVVRRDFPYEVH